MEKQIQDIFQLYKKEIFIHEFRNEECIEKIIIAYFNIFGEKLTSKKYKELFFEDK